MAHGAAGTFQNQRLPRPCSPLVRKMWLLFCKSPYGRRKFWEHPKIVRNERENETQSQPQSDFSGFPFQVLRGAPHDPIPGVDRGWTPEGPLACIRADTPTPRAHIAKARKRTDRFRSHRGAVHWPVPPRSSDSNMQRTEDPSTHPSEEPDIAQHHGHS